MSTYTMQLRWQRQGATFTDNCYARAHTWHFDGGVQVPASSSPHVVPPPYSEPANVDPEEAYVAALASCHMLTFLWLAAQRGFVVDAYDDHPVGVMGVNAQGRECITQVTLHPHIIWGAAASVDEATVTQLHHQAHAQCYLANSVTTRIAVQGSWEQP
jgi:organic hydroperoxide reductase OsmC/OhrA